ncbi:MAG: lipoyl synthase [Bdellovibrionota bacterium]
MKSETAYARKPEWLRRPPGSAPQTAELKRLLRRTKLNTVCEEARCPNISECFRRGTATFMILGDVCTRGCRFCAVQTGKPSFAESSFASEGAQVAEAASQLNLKHVVVTSVARDDLADGGASGFVATIGELRKKLPHATVEVLIPDFRGNEDALLSVVAAGPDVLNHNLETVPRLYRRVRPGSVYERSLDLLKRAKNAAPKLLTKTGIMLGLGETEEEVRQLLVDARAADVDIFTAGQYMQPSRDHLPVTEYLSPETFSQYEAACRSIGFPQVYVGPLVRSSYHADELLGADRAPATTIGA